MVEPLLGFAILGFPVILEDFCSFLTEALYILAREKKKKVTHIQVKLHLNRCTDSDLNHLISYDVYFVSMHPMLRASLL